MVCTWIHTVNQISQTSYLDDVDKFRAEDHGYALSPEAELVLEIAQEVAEVDVEELQGHNSITIENSNELTFY